MSSSDTFASFLFYSYDWTEEPPSSPPKLRFNKGRYILPLRLAKQLLQTPPDFPDDSLVMEAIEEPPPEPPPADRKDEPVPRGILDDMTDTARGILDSGMLDSTLLSARAGLDATRSFLRSPVSSTRAFVKETLLPSAIPFLAAYGPYLVHYAIDYSGEYFQKQSFSSFLGPSTPQHREDPMAAVGSAIALPPTPPHPPDEKGGVLSQVSEGLTKIHRGLKAIDPLRFPMAEAAEIKYECTVDPSYKAPICGYRTGGFLNSWKPDPTVTPVERGPGCTRMENDDIVCKKDNAVTRYKGIPKGEICTAETDSTTMNDRLTCVDPVTMSPTRKDVLPLRREQDLKEVANGATIIDKRLPALKRDYKCTLTISEDKKQTIENCTITDPTDSTRPPEIKIIKHNQPVTLGGDDGCTESYFGWVYDCPTKRSPDGKYSVTKTYYDKRTTDKTDLKCKILPSGDIDCDDAIPRGRIKFTNPKPSIEQKMDIDCPTRKWTEGPDRTYKCINQVDLVKVVEIDITDTRPPSIDPLAGLERIYHEMQTMVSWDDTTLQYSIPFLISGLNGLSGAAIRLFPMKHQSGVIKYLRCANALFFFIATWRSLDILFLNNTIPETVVASDTIFQIMKSAASTVGGTFVKYSNLISVMKPMAMTFETASSTRLIASGTMSVFLTGLLFGEYWKHLRHLFSGKVGRTNMLILFAIPVAVCAILGYNNSLTLENVISKCIIDNWCCSCLPVGIAYLFGGKSAAERKIKLGGTAFLFLTAAVGALRTETLGAAANIVKEAPSFIMSSFTTFTKGGLSAAYNFMFASKAATAVAETPDLVDKAAKTVSIWLNYKRVGTDFAFVVTECIYLVPIVILIITLLINIVASWQVSRHTQNDALRDAAFSHQIQEFENDLCEVLLYPAIMSLATGGFHGVSESVGLVGWTGTGAKKLHSQTRNPKILKIVGAATEVLRIKYPGKVPDPRITRGVFRELLKASESFSVDSVQELTIQLRNHMKTLEGKPDQELFNAGQEEDYFESSMEENMALLGGERARGAASFLQPTVAAITASGGGAAASGGGGGAADTTITQTALKAFQLFCYWKQLDEEEDYDEEEEDHVRNNILYYRGLFLYHRVRIHETLRKYNILVNKFSKADIAKIAEEAQNLIIGLNNGDNSENLEFKGKMEEIGREGYNDTTDTLENLAERAERDSLEVSDEHSSGDGSIQI